MKMSKKYYYDKESDSIFICMKEGEEEGFEEIAPGINTELNEKDKVIGD